MGLMEASLVLALGITCLGRIFKVNTKYKFSDFVSVVILGVVSGATIAVLVLNI